MKFLDNLERMFARLNRLGIFFGACTAGFRAAHEYVQKRNGEVIDDKKTEKHDGHAVTDNH